MKTIKKVVLAVFGLSVSALAVSCNLMDVVPSVDPKFSNSGGYSTTSDSLSGCTVYRPAALDDSHPIVVWGNGTGSTPITYAGFLRHLASHGFVVVAANTPSAGNGRAMVDCVDQTLAEYADNVDPDRIGASGHSQGGGGAIMAGQDERLTTTAPMQPYVNGLGHIRSSQRNQNGPMFLMSGSNDTIASPQLNQRPVFNRANVEVFWGILQGAGHTVPTGNAGAFRGPATAWFLYQLMDDKEAAEVFVGPDCTLCTSSAWEVRKKRFP